MWFDRKDITHEEAEKEYKRLLALEEREDDEFDEYRISQMTSADDLDVLKGIEDYKKEQKK